MKCWVTFTKFSAKLVVCGGLKKLKIFGVAGDAAEGLITFRCVEGLNVSARGHFDIQGLSKTLFIG